ncbi:MAG: bifunctional DNA primase/polymerase [Stenotrophomonas maltophilia]
MPVNPGMWPGRATRADVDATLDPVKIQDWWDEWPDAKIAVRTGKILAAMSLRGPPLFLSRAIFFR